MKESEESCQVLLAEAVNGRERALCAQLREAMRCLDGFSGKESVSFLDFMKNFEKLSVSKNSCKLVEKFEKTQSSITEFAASCARSRRTTVGVLRSRCICSRVACIYCDCRYCHEIHPKPRLEMRAELRNISSKH